jgi:hypothetical protein
MYVDVAQKIAGPGGTRLKPLGRHARLSSLVAGPSFLHATREKQVDGRPEPGRTTVQCDGEAITKIPIAPDAGCFLCSARQFEACCVPGRD